MEPPLRQRERQRLEVLRRYPVLDALPEDSFNGTTGLARRIFGVTVAAIFIPARQRIFFDASVDLNADRLAELCAALEFAETSARVLVHEDLNRIAAASGHTLVRERPGLRSFAAAPLRTSDDVVVGSICLIDTASRAFSNAEVEMLLGFADTAMQELDLRQAGADADRLVRDHPHPIWTYDLTSLRVLAANEATCRFYGYESAQLLEKSLGDLLPEEEVRALTEAHARGAGTEHMGAARHRRSDGNLLSAGIITHPTHWRGVPARSVEVTAVAQAEEEEDRRAESFYRRLIDEMPVEVTVLDTEGRILFQNEAGVDEPELRSWSIGKTMAEYYARLGFPPSVARRRHQELAVAVRERRTTVFQESVPTASGEVRQFIRLMRPVLRQDGSVKYVTTSGVASGEPGAITEPAVEQDQRFRTLLRNIPLGMAMLDLQGRILEANPAFGALADYDPVAPTDLETALIRSIHPDDAAGVRNLYEEVAAGHRESGQIEARLVRADSNPLRVDISFAVVRDARHRPSRAILVLDDVTEARSAERDLQRSAQRYSVLIDEAPDAIFVARYRGAIIEANQRARALTGYSREELLRMRPEDLIRNGSLDADPTVWDLIGGGETVELERRLLRRNGPPVAAEFSLKLIANRYVLISARDAEGRAERSRRLEFQADALAQISEPVIATDILGVITYVNAAAERLLGISSGDAIGRHTSEVIKARLAGNEQIGQIAEMLFQTGHWRGEVILELAGNVKLYTETSVRLARDRDNLPVGTIAVARDITERKEYERDLVTAKEEAEELNRLKTAFLANMSHEIRTPLTSIIGFAEVLAEEASESEKEFASLIRNSGRRLLETLNSVLDLAQLESEALKLEPAPIDVMEPVRDTLELFRAQAQERGLYLEAEADRPGPITARLDRVGLSRILINLVSNAVKFTHQGGVRVYVRSDEDHVHIVVKDTGIGIGPDFIPHLFDEFKQESSGLSRAYEGSGLGLTITKRLVELMDGAIDVESEKGHGTQFIVTFPK